MLNLFLNCIKQSNEGANKMFLDWVSQSSHDFENEFQSWKEKTEHSSVGVVPALQLCYVTELVFLFLVLLWIFHTAIHSWTLSERKWTMINCALLCHLIPYSSTTTFPLSLPSPASQFSPTKLSFPTSGLSVFIPQFATYVTTLFPVRLVIGLKVACDAT